MDEDGSDDEDDSEEEEETPKVYVWTSFLLMTIFLFDSFSYIYIYKG